MVIVLFIYVFDSLWLSDTLCICFAAPRLVHGVGLVYVPGRLRPTHLKVSSSQPFYCTSTFGKVSIHLVHSSPFVVTLMFFKIYQFKRSILNMF